MSDTSSELTSAQLTTLMEQIKAALALAVNRDTYAQAKQQLTEIQSDLETQGIVCAPLVRMLWEDSLSANRSAIFWHELADMEKSLADGLSLSALQAKQNYLRLVQEQ